MEKGRLGFWGLAALVFGMVVGAGTYNLPQVMSAVATPVGVALAWTVTGAGILPLVLGFKWLSNRYPELNAGIYQYAQAGFGNFAGFNIAWGYWLCTAFSNVAYGVMLNDAAGAFFPVLLRHGWPSVCFASVLIWVMYFIVSRGLQTAKVINTALAAVKVAMLVMITALMVMALQGDLFEANMRGHVPAASGLGGQLKSTMMVTLFCFFGVEGAVMMSARARRASDVGRASVVGFAMSLAVYLCVSLLCFGVMPASELRVLQDPSIAPVLGATAGEWAYWFVIASVIVSLLGGWVAWTLVVAQVPYEAAVVQILPRIFMRTNRHGIPAFGLFMSSVVMTLFLCLVAMADDVYVAAIHVSSLMIIPGYLFTGLFMLKKGEGVRVRVIGAVTTLFCLWMAYAGGLEAMFMTSVLYLAGIGFYVRARHEDAPGKPVLTRGEKVAFAVLCLCGAVTVAVLLT